MGESYQIIRCLLYCSRAPLFFFLLNMLRCITLVISLRYDFSYFRARFIFTRFIFSHEIHVLAALIITTAVFYPMGAELQVLQTWT